MSSESRRSPHRICIGRWNFVIVVLIGLLQLCCSFSVASSGTPSPSDQHLGRPIPVTVLSGFLGSGKTTLLQNLLENSDGLRIAVVVNDVAAVNIDSKLVSNQNEAAGMVELQNGCACCSRSEELLASVAQLVGLSDARPKGEGFQHIVIEMSGVADPRSVRAKFQEALMYEMPLMERAQLDTMVTVVDCGVFLDSLGSDKVATTEETPELFYRNGEEAEADRQWLDDDDLPPGLLEALSAGETAAANSVSDLLVSQTEIADVVLLNKVDQVGAKSPTVERIESVVRALNPRCDVIRTSFGKAPLASILGAGGGQGVVGAGVIDDHKDAVEAALLSHDPNCSDPDCSHDSHSHLHSHAGEKSDDQDKHEDHSHSHSHGSENGDHAPSHAEFQSVCDDPTCTEDHDHSHSHSETTSSHAGIGTYVYQSRRPFSPVRLLAFLRNLPATRGLPEIGDHEYQMKMSNDDKHILKSIMRSKGFVWCADSNEIARYWSQAGISFELTALGKWWATLPRDQWPPGAVDAILSDFDNPDHIEEDLNVSSVGDRRQEIVLIGPGLGAQAVQDNIKTFLDACLLDDDELSIYSKNRSDEQKLSSMFQNNIQATILQF